MDAINWLRDQDFEQGMTIYIYREREREIFIISSEEAWVVKILQK